MRVLVSLPTLRSTGPGGRWWLVAVLVVVLGACGGGEVVDFGAEPAPDAPSVPADGGVDVADVEPPDAIPPRDADLAEAGWPEAAAWIAREAAADRPVLVNIFASWCGPCRREMPMLIEAADANPDIAFLGIDHVDRFEDGRAFVDELGVTFPTLFDIDGDVAFAVGGRGMPTTVVFDRDGRLTGRVIGELTATSLEQLLDEVR